MTGAWARVPRVRRVHVVLILGALLALSATVASEAQAGSSQWRSPFLLEDGPGLYGQYGYLPDYTRHVPAFDAAGHAYIRSRTSTGARSSYVHTLQRGAWESRDFEEALRTAYPDYSGTVGAAGLRSDRIVFDRQDRAYNPLIVRLDDGSTRNVLMVSWDRCRTWEVFELPAGQFAVEHWVGHNEIDGPPFLAYWRPYLPSAAYDIQRNSLWVTKPRLDGRTLIIPAATLVTNECLGLNRDSGGASFAVTQGEKTTFVWAEATPLGTSATPQYVAVYDHASGVVSHPELLAKSRPANDTHNKPGLCSDGEGYIHFIAGTHGTAALYRRTLQPYAPLAGWTSPETVLGSGYVVDGQYPSVQEARQTYAAFVCDSKGTLHLVTRQWRRGVDVLHDGREYGALVHQALPRGGVWSPPTLIVAAATPGYAIFYHKLALDHRDRLFLSCSYSGGTELKEQKSWSAAQARLGRSEPLRGKYVSRMLLVSDDGGSNWRFAENVDLTAEGEAAPQARPALSKEAPAAAAIGTIWSWVQPRPQGNQLTGVDFVDGAVGWAVGTYGTILRSTDGGVTWTQQVTPTTANLYGVAAIDGRTAWAVGQAGTVLCTRDGGRTWRAQDSHVTTTFFSVTAVSAKKAWAVGDRGLVRATEDGGKTWRRQYSKTTQHLYSVTFTDGLRGWTCGGAGRLLSTKDGGRHWLLQRTMVSEGLHAVSFIDKKYGVAVGAAGGLLSSRDGGRSWRPSDVRQTTSLRAVKMVSRNLVYATGAAGAFLTSRDGGRTWVKRTLSVDGMCGALDADARGRLWVGGAGGAVTRSRNGGRTWSSLRPELTASLRAVAAADGGLWLAGSGGLLSHSDDGVTWVRRETGTAADLDALSLRLAEGWAAGAAGTVLHSVDSGATWTRLSAPSSHGLAAVVAVGAGEAWVAGAEGTLLHTADGGASWDSTGTPAQDMTCVSFLGRRGWASGGRSYGESRAGLLRTDDDGLHWEAVELPIWGRVMALHFLTAEAGWAVAEDWGPDADRRGGAILATRDGGRTWALQARGARVMRSVHMNDALNGWAFGEGGTALQTTDGGRTWAWRDVHTDSTLNATVEWGGRSLVFGDGGAILLGIPPATPGPGATD